MHRNYIQLFAINTNNNFKEYLGALQKKQINSLSDWGIDTLVDGLQEHVKSVVVETNYVCKDHRNLYSNYIVKKFKQRNLGTFRFHFFASQVVPNNGGILDSQILADHAENYIGYSIIRDVERGCIGRTVIDPCKLGLTCPKGFHILRTPFQVHINGITLSVNGYPFISQDTEATVCAHSALWGVCRYLSERYSVYKELYPFDFIKLTDTSRGRTYPNKGMNFFDYSTILTSFGTYPHIGLCKDHSENEKKIRPESFEKIYYYLESGFPILASLPRHVITLVGHTIDYSRSPDSDEDGFIDSSKFMNQFIVVDDNFFPYKLLGFSDDNPELNFYASNFFPEKSTIDSLKTFVCPLPEKVFLESHNAKNIALDFVKQNHIDKLNEISKKPFITRLFLASSVSYKKRKLDYIRGENLKSTDFAHTVANLNLPHFIWVLEITEKDSYKEGKAVGEIIIDATSGKFESGILWVRIGKDAYILGEKLTEEQDQTPEFSIYTHNLGEKNE